MGERRMTWLATSPHGPLASVSWQCADCPEGSHGYALGDAAEVLRGAARTHVETAGHIVAITRGTTETLYPMNMTAKD